MRAFKLRSILQRVRQLLLLGALVTGCLTQLLLPMSATAMVIGSARAAAGICSIDRSGSTGEHAADALAMHAGHCAVCAFAASGAAPAATMAAGYVGRAGDAFPAICDAEAIRSPDFLRPSSQAPPASV